MARGYGNRFDLGQDFTGVSDYDHSTLELIRCSERVEFAGVVARFRLVECDEGGQPISEQRAHERQTARRPCWGASPKRPRLTRRIDRPCPRRNGSPWAK